MRRGFAHAVDSVEDAVLWAHDAYDKDTNPNASLACFIDTNN